ncbi:dTDP-4-dehydrorhamnose 3,5-epimerase [Orrella marina]|uniref:dTDP-4-dehydrorhamnose 3,5-epimerase n=1 Tax=Orrella marina TaxID=2163011 RepID=A0A2R4XGX7_9BURK|nr:dTDP-4-dehydrorhamnose 3,5-epimerase [Orrella marina]AWB33041.1 dTDP-4-dehydrorhamnose 3,5-epimerase [Orrella marina]
MKLTPTVLSGCFRVHPFISKDDRGAFVKTFHSMRFAELGLPTMWHEEYYSSSRKGVIRGMHFQTPPNDHEKLVYCIHGKVLDVVLDLRKESATYGQCTSVELDSTYGHGLIIPKGMAHGFLALSDDALLAYKVTSVYAPSNDLGIRWDSFGFEWGIDKPVISERDHNHPMLKDFSSPF